MRARYYYTAAGKEHYAVDYKARRKVFYVPCGPYSETAKRAMLAQGMRLARARILELNARDKALSKENAFKEAEHPKPPETMLKQVERANVVDVFLMPNKDKLCLMERCDGYYDIELTKDESQQLVNELQQLVDQMV